MSDTIGTPVMLTPQIRLNLPKFVRRKMVLIGTAPVRIVTKKYHATSIA